MCGRYGFTASDKELSERFDAELYARDIEYDFHDNFNVAPTHEMPVIERHSPNSIHIRKWGIQPSWSHFALINAKADKLMGSRVWSKAFQENRVIVPADWFYEWMEVDGNKYPYLIRAKNKKTLGLAGILVEYHDKGGEKKEGYVIITTEPNSLLAKIHNTKPRNPAILRDEYFDAWLNPDTEPERLMKMLDPIPSDELEAYSIGRSVNSIRNNEASLTEPVDYKIPEAPAHL